MRRIGLLTKVLAISGAVLVWFPIVATVVTAAVGSIRSRTLRFDYLMPAELFPVVLAGAGLLLWAALRARSRRDAIGWGLAMILALLIGGQALAVASGMASGETEPAGWIWVLVIASLVGYTLALLELGIAGLLLIRDIFQHSDQDGPVLPSA
jgi:hypothetical protein